MPLTLVILAAGIGSRYGGLKQIEPVGPSGEIVVDYSVFDALRAGFDRVVFVIRRDIEADFNAAIGSRLGRRARVDYVFQASNDLPPGFTFPADRKKPWGTGQAILACRDAVREPFAAINADDFYGRESFQALAGFLKGVAVHETRYAMVGFVLRHTLSEHGHVARGICRMDDAGFLVSVTETTRIEKSGAGARFAAGDGQWQSLSGDELVSMNMWGFTPALFSPLAAQFRDFLSAAGKDPKAEFYIPTAVDRMIREKAATVRVLPTPEKWFGVTYPADKPGVVAGIRELVAAGAYPERLWG